MPNSSNSQPNPLRPNSRDVDLPLSGQTILITRPRKQGKMLSQTLADLGASSILHPAIEILTPGNPEAIDDCIGRLNQFTWIVFVSANGVQHFFQRMLKLLDSVPQTHKYAAIGNATLERLREITGQPAITPQSSDSESLAELLIKVCLLYTSPSPRDRTRSRMPSSA